MKSKRTRRYSVHDIRSRNNWKVWVAYNDRICEQLKAMKDFEKVMESMLECTRLETQIHL